MQARGGEEQQEREHHEAVRVLDDSAARDVHVAVGEGVVRDERRAERAEDDERTGTGEQRPARRGAADGDVEQDDCRGHDAVEVVGPGDGADQAAGQRGEGDADELVAPPVRADRTAQRHDEGAARARASHSRRPGYCGRSRRARGRGGATGSTYCTAGRRGRSPERRHPVLRRGAGSDDERDQRGDGEGADRYRGGPPPAGEQQIDEEECPA